MTRDPIAGLVIFYAVCLAGQFATLALVRYLNRRDERA